MSAMDVKPGSVVQFGKFGTRLHQLSRGGDERPVSLTVFASQLAPSARLPMTYLPNACNTELRDLFEDLQRRLAKAKCINRIKAGR